MQNEDEKVGIARDNPVMGIFFLVWFIGSIAILYLAAKGALPLYMISIGLGQFFLGITGIIGASIVKMLQKHRAQAWGPVAFTILLLISISGYLLIKEQNNESLDSILSSEQRQFY